MILATQSFSQLKTLECKILMFPYFFLILDFYLTAKNVCGHFSKIYNHVVPSHIYYLIKSTSQPHYLKQYYI